MSQIEEKFSIDFINVIAMKSITEFRIILFLLSVGGPLTESTIFRNGKFQENVSNVIISLS